MDGKRISLAACVRRSQKRLMHLWVGTSFFAYPDSHLRLAIPRATISQVSRQRAFTFHLPLEAQPRDPGPGTIIATSPSNPSTTTAPKTTLHTSGALSVATGEAINNMFNFHCQPTGDVRVVDQSKTFDVLASKPRWILSSLHVRARW